jgi:hypothetical protein
VVLFRRHGGPVASWALLTDCGMEAEAEAVDEGSIAKAWRLIERATSAVDGAVGSGEPDPQDLLLAIRIAGEHPNVSHAAHLTMAKLLGDAAADVDTDGLREAVRHGRQAMDAARLLDSPEPQFSTSAAVLGGLLLRLADRLPELERNGIVGEAIDLLRDSVRGSGPDSGQLIRRKANLAVALQAPVPGLSSIEVASRLTEAAEILAALLEGPHEHALSAQLMMSAAHVEQQRAAIARRLQAADDPHGDLAFARAERLYSDAIELLTVEGGSVGAATMGLSRLKFEAAEHSGSARLLDESIEHGRAALTALVGDIGFEREAEMQVAQQYLARYKRRHLPSDAAWADRLSADALSTWYHELGSIEWVHAQHRRLDVLCSVALSPIGTDDHFFEADDLLRDLYAPDDRTPQMDAIGAMANVARDLGSASDVAIPASVHSQLIEHANRFEQVLLSNDFVSNDPAWWNRWFSTHQRIASWAEWIGIDRMAWTSPFAGAAERHEHRLRQLSHGTDTAGQGYLQLATATRIIGSHRGQEIDLHRSLEFLRAASAEPAVLSPAHRIAIGVEGAFVCDLLNDPAGVLDWMAVARSALLDLEEVTAGPLAARIAVDRERYELAGFAAVIEVEPSDLAWAMHTTVYPTRGGPASKASFLDALALQSDSVVTVFVAQGRRRCRASILRDSEWSAVELPGLAIDRIGGPIVAAHRAHAAAKSGRVKDKQAWASARRDLDVALAKAIEPLGVALSTEARPIALRLSGWLHAVPIASTLLAKLGHSTPIVVSLGIPADTDEGHPAAAAGLLRDGRVIALAAPGDGIRHRSHRSSISASFESQAWS